MKAITAVCSTGASVPAISTSGRISRPNHPHRNGGGGDGENAEMKMYLSKLKDLVPFMPKNRKLSKLEIIQHVIDYICDLQSELETHPAINNFDAAAALTSAQQMMYYQQSGGDERINYNNNSHHFESTNSSPVQASVTPRQPLVDRQSPNTICVTSAAAAAAAHHLQHISPVVSSIIINGNSLTTHSHTTEKPNSDHISRSS